MHHHHRVFTSLLITLFLLFGLSTLLAAEAEVVLPSYDLKVKIEPEMGSIAVQAHVETRVDDLSAHELRFNLHETFAISKLLINGKEAYFTYATIDPTPVNPATRAVVVTLPENLSAKELCLDVEYAGQLKKLPEFGASPGHGLAMDDQVNSRMVELAGYSSWYPQFAFGPPIRAQFEVSLPKGWIAVCSGVKLGEKVKAGWVTSRWSSPKDLDVVIVASPNFREYAAHQAGVDVVVYYTQLPVSFIAGEAAQISSVLNLYSETLGPTPFAGQTVRHVYSPKCKGQGKAGMSRAGLIVTSEGLTLESLAKDPQFSLLQPIAHEVAHFWWNFGTGQGDWINEAFAEYFSAVAVQKTVSQAAFESVLKDYYHQVARLPADAPSLATIPFQNNQVGFVVRYYKGSLMLNDVRARMGDAAFFAACREFFQTDQGKSVGTGEFRSFWSQKLASHVDVLAAWLDSSGGVPDLTKLASR